MVQILGKMSVALKKESRHAFHSILLWERNSI